MVWGPFGSLDQVLHFVVIYINVNCERFSAWNLLLASSPDTSAQNTLKVFIRDKGYPETFTKFYLVLFSRGALVLDDRTTTTCIA